MSSDPKKLFSYETLLEQLRQYGAYAGLIGSILLPIVCGDVNSIPTFEGVLDDDQPITDDMFRIPDDLKATYNKRVVDMVADMASYGCI